MDLVRASLVMQTLPIAKRISFSENDEDYDDGITRLNYTYKPTTTQAPFSGLVAFLGEKLFVVHDDNGEDILAVTTSAHGLSQAIADLGEGRPLLPETALHTNQYVLAELVGRAKAAAFKDGAKFAFEKRVSFSGGFRVTANLRFPTPKKVVFTIYATATSLRVYREGRGKDTEFNTASTLSEFRSFLTRAAKEVAEGKLPLIRSQKAMPSADADTVEDEVPRKVKRKPTPDADTASDESFSVTTPAGEVLTQRQLTAISSVLNSRLHTKSRNKLEKDFAIKLIELSEPVPPSIVHTLEGHTFGVSQGTVELVNKLVDTCKSGNETDILLVKARLLSHLNGMEA